MVLFILAAPHNGLKTQNLDPLQIQAQVSFERAAEFIAEKKGDFELSSAFFIDFLARRNNLEAHFLFENIRTGLRLDSFKFRRQENTVRKFMRLVDANAEVPTEIIAFYHEPENRLEELANMERMMLGALHDEFYDDFWPIAFQLQLEEGEFGLTHAAVSYQWMKELGKELPLAKKGLKKVKRELKKLIRKSKENLDLHFEAMAILHYLFPNTAYKKSQINRLVQFQEDDGGWSIMADHNYSSDHTTMLAVWNLLNYLEPEKKHFPMLPQ